MTDSTKINSSETIRCHDGEVVADQKRRGARPVSTRTSEMMMKRQTLKYTGVIMTPAMPLSETRGWWSFVISLPSFDIKKREIGSAVAPAGLRVLTQNEEVSKWQMGDIVMATGSLVCCDGLKDAIGDTLVFNSSEITRMIEHSKTGIGELGTNIRIVDQNRSAEPEQPEDPGVEAYKEVRHDVGKIAGGAVALADVLKALNTKMDIVAENDNSELASTENQTGNTPNENASDKPKLRRLDDEELNEANQANADQDNQDENSDASSSSIFDELAEGSMEEQGIDENETADNINESKNENNETEDNENNTLQNAEDETDVYGKEEDESNGNSETTIKEVEVKDNKNNRNEQNVSPQKLASNMIVISGKIPYEDDLGPVIDHIIRRSKLKSLVVKPGSVKKICDASKPKTELIAQ